MQANNIYAYCGNNPIIFTDCDGLDLVVLEDEEKANIVLDDLSKITDDELDISESFDEQGRFRGYEVFIVNQNEGEHENGTKLIRSILNSKKTCGLYITDVIDFTVIDEHELENASNGTGSNVFVGYTLGFSFDPVISKLTNNVGMFDGITPAYIRLSHELIHADRAMRGNRIEYSQMDTYTYKKDILLPLWGVLIKVPIIKNDSIPKEELATIGLKYNSGKDITENMIRQECGLGERGAY